MQAVQINLDWQIHAALAAERTEEGDGLSRNALGVGRDIAGAPFAAFDRGLDDGRVGTKG
jgi:hypothetical protein